MRGVLSILGLSLIYLGSPPILGAQSPDPLLPEGLPRAEEADVLSGRLPTGANVDVIHWPNGRARAERLLAVLTDRPLLPGIPDSIPTEVRFYLAPDSETWDFLTGGQVPEWGAGVAIPDRHTAVIPLFEAPSGGIGSRDRTVLHEWAHLGLHEYLDGLRIPRWFDEGYAQRASGGWNVAEGWRLRLGLMGSSSPPLDSLSLDWPRGRSDAELAYLLSGSAVEYLVSRSGERGLEVLLARWRETRSFEGAFRETFGYATGTFETRWLAYVRRRFGWTLLLTQTALFWAATSLVLVFLVRLRVRRNRERLARLRATQPPARPAYWETPVPPWRVAGPTTVSGERKVDHS